MGERLHPWWAWAYLHAALAETDAAGSLVSGPERGARSETGGE